MLSEETVQIVERRSQSHTLIQELVDTRNEMLSLFSRLIIFKPFTDSDDGTREILEEFCETLVDYTLQAHLNIYRHIEEKLEKRVAVLELAEKNYPSILRSTELISEFNDLYEDLSNHFDTSQLEQNLSRLGEVLAERIELEDQLIAVLTNRRPDQSDSDSLNS